MCDLYRNCDICKKKEAIQFIKNLSMCDACYFELMNSFSYHIGGKEKTKEEYDRFIGGNE